MKNIRLIVLTLLASITMYGQELKQTEVPSSFTDGLLKAYPNATDIEWERNGNDYKVEFDSGMMEHEIWFNKTGDMVRIQRDITRKELPTAVADIIKRDYADYTIDDIESVFKDGVTTFIVELEKGWFDAVRITFSSAGKVLNVSNE